MAKTKFVRKISNILLAIMLCVSLLLFSACSAGDDSENKPVLKIVYRPYSTSKVFSSSDDTYIDVIYENIFEVSQNVLTEVVGQYGMGKISTGLSDSRYPSTNGRDYETMFGISAANKLLGFNNQTIGEDMGKMTHVNYTHEFNILGVSTEINALILSYGDSPTIIDILTQILIPGDTPLTILGSVEGTEIYRIDTGSTVYYVFLGGNGLGMNGEQLSYVPISNGDGSYNFETTTKTFLKHILGCNYGVIEKDYIATENISIGQTTPLNFQHWNYSVAEGDIENKLPASGDGNFVATGNPYLEKYLEKYSLTFAVDIAKAMLVGGEELPTEVNCPKDLLSGDKMVTHTGGIIKLKSLYERAKSGSDDEKKEFIWTASAFVDHLGLTKDDLTFIASQLKSDVIGEDIYNSTDKKEGDNIPSTILNNNYDVYLSESYGTESGGSGGENASSALKNALDGNPTKPILEWLSFENSSHIEKTTINGYLQSIILMSEGEIDLEYFDMEVTFADDAIIDYVLLTRSGSNNGQEIYENKFPTANDDLLNKGMLEIDIQEKDESGNSLYFGTTTLSGKKDVLIGNNSCLVLGALNANVYKAFNTDNQKFVHSNVNDKNIYYHGWYLDYKTNFMELVFATKNVFSLTNINFEKCTFSYF